MSQETLMKFDPAGGTAEPYPSHAKQWRIHHGQLAWLINPWTGERRSAGDVGSDPFGLLMLPPGEQLHAKDQSLQHRQDSRTSGKNLFSYLSSRLKPTRMVNTCSHGIQTTHQSVCLPPYPVSQRSKTDQDCINDLTNANRAGFAEGLKTGQAMAQDGWNAGVKSAVVKESFTPADGGDN